MWKAYLFHEEMQFGFSEYSLAQNLKYKSQIWKGSKDSKAPSGNSIK